MSTYNIVCQSYYVVLVLEGPSQLFQRNQIPCPPQRQMGCAFPTARSSFLASQQARQCQSVRNTVFVVFSHPKNGLWLWLIGIAFGPANCADCLWVCQRASQYQSWTRSSRTVFRCYPRGWRRGCCTCNGVTYPLKPGVVVACMGSPRTDFA
jgi:hypothetical protein